MQSYLSSSRDTVPSTSYHTIGHTHHASSSSSHLENLATLPATVPLNEDFPEPGRFDFLHGNTVIPDNTFGPDEERIFIDDDTFDVDETVFEIEHANQSNDKESHHRDRNLSPPTVTMVNFENHQQHPTRHHHGITESTSRHRLDRNQRRTQSEESSSSSLKINDEIIVTQSQETNKDEIKNVENLTDVSTENNNDKEVRYDDSSLSPYVSPDSLEEDKLQTLSVDKQEMNETNSTNDSMDNNDDNETIVSVTTLDNASLVESDDNETEEPKEETESGKSGKDMMRNIAVTDLPMNKSFVTPFVLGSERYNHEPTIGSVGVYGKGKSEINIFLSKTKIFN